MDVDLMDTVQQASERKDRFNALIAITVALLATFTGICKVKDDNIVQAMQQAQADRIDHWSWYQSLHVREEFVADTLANIELQKAVGASTSQAEFDKAITEIKAKLAHVTSHKEELAAQAKQDQQKYDDLNYRDDQFDLSDALMALAISLLAITALVQKRWLYIVALVPTVLGTFMGLAGLLGWHVHSDTIATWLS